KKMLAQLGMDGASLPTDGKIDWLTLIGLDLCAAAHESAPPPPAPKATHAPPPPPPPPPAPPPARPAAPPPAQPAAPAPAQPPPAPAPAPAAPTAAAPTAAGAGDYVFDGKTKTLSLRLGMKMYKALLGWEADGAGNGVGYSTCNPNHYGTV